MRNAVPRSISARIDGVIVRVALFALLSAMLPCIASAQENGDAVWNSLVAAAKQEGEVTLITPPSASHREFLAREWPKAFPDIKLSQTSVPPGQQFTRLSLERSAGKYLWDLAFTGSDNAFQLRDAGMLDKIRPEFVLPDVKNPATWGGWDEAFADTAHEYVFTSRTFLKMPFYNAKLLSPGKVKAEGTKIFLDPALKKKVIWDDPQYGGSGRTFAPVMLRLLGEDGLRKFVTEQVVFTTRMSDLFDRMARSQYVMSLGPVLTGLLTQYRDAGVALDIRPLGNTPALGAYANTGASNIVVMKNRPHPNAARLFLNWYLSKPVEAALAKEMGEDTRRTDVPQQVDPAQQRLPGIKYYDAQSEANTPAARKAQALIAKFREKP
jgi:ABC-type glycerol-3-phosphate transport system substrate-binding protein